MAKKMSAKKIHRTDSVTVCGALSPTGPGAKLAKDGGGKIYHVKHVKGKTKRAEKVSSMTIAESLGDLGDGTHHVGP